MVRADMYISTVKNNSLNAFALPDMPDIGAMPLLLYCLPLYLYPYRYTATLTATRPYCFCYYLLGGTGSVPGTAVVRRISAITERVSALRMRAAGLSINLCASVASASAFTSSGIT